MSVDKEKCLKILQEISEYLNQGKGEEGLALLNDNREMLYEYDPLITLRTAFELRFILKQFDEAYEDYEFYSNLPYVSQEVEETLRGLPKIIRANELASKTGDRFDEEEAHAALSDGEDPYAVLAVLQTLRGRDLKPYTEELRNILDSKIHDDVKTFALCLLVDASIDDEFVLIKNNKTFKINPSKLGNPFASKEYLEARTKIEAFRDSSLASVCSEILDQIYLSAYPEKVYPSEDIDPFMDAIQSVGRRYLGQGEESLTEEKAQGYQSRITSLLEVTTLLR